MADPISDMLIRIKNAYKAGHEAVQIPYSKFKQEIAKTMERAGFIEEIERKGKRVRKTLEIKLRYKKEEPALAGIKLISKPSRRLYTSYQDLGKPRHGGMVILSTPKGVMSSLEAKKNKVGGEMIAEVW